MNLFYYRCGVEWFRVPYDAYNAILGIENSNLRSSAYKLYRWMLSISSAAQNNDPILPAKLSHYDEIEKHTGLSRSIESAWQELRRLGLIRAEFQGGPGGHYEFTLLTPSKMSAEERFPLYWTTAKARYFAVPSVTVWKETYLQWSGTTALVYDKLCQMMNDTGKNELARPQRHWFKPIRSKNTLPKAEQFLIHAGLIRIKDDGKVIEVLHPERSESMPEKGWDQPKDQRTYYIDKSGFRRLFSEEQLSREDFERYFRKSIRNPEEWTPGDDACCPFHDDRKPSLSINIETGQFCCHAGCIAGNKLVTFEMNFPEMDGDDVHRAWASVCKKLGFKVGRSSAKVTSKHTYTDENGEPIYQIRRLEDGTGRFWRYVAGAWRPGLGKPVSVRRTLYNLPCVIDAGTVVILEGEKKSDAVSDLYLKDNNDQPVAVTTSGSVDSWRFRFADYLIGKKVLILPDADPDDKGRRYAEAIQASLTKVGVEHQTVYFDEFGKDVRDFLEQYTTEEQKREELVTYLNDQIGTPWLTTKLPVYEPIAI